MTTTTRGPGGLTYVTLALGGVAALAVGFLAGSLVGPLGQSSAIDGSGRDINATTPAASAPSVVVIAVPGGQTLTLPAELAVDLVGGDIGIHAPMITVAIPGGESITLPAELAVDLVGGATGVRSPFVVITIPGGESITLPAELAVDLIGGDTGVERP